MNPIPQLVKPILDVYANKDSFTGRPIETMGMEKMLPEYRYNQHTSMAARGISTVGNAISGENFMSPVQIDHLIQGYFGWLGTFIVGASDLVARPLTGQPSNPTPDYTKIATGGLVKNLPEDQSRYVTQMYNQAKEIEEAYGTYKNLQKQGKHDEAKAFRKDHEDDLKKFHKIEAVKRQESVYNERIRAIERNELLSPDEKKDKIENLRRLQNVKAKRISEAHP